MCGAAAWALSASMLSHFSSTTKVSGPYLVCIDGAGSASIAGPYSMHPFSARTAGDVGAKVLQNVFPLAGLGGDDGDDVDHAFPLSF